MLRRGGPLHRWGPPPAATFHRAVTTTGQSVRPLSRGRQPLGDHRRRLPDDSLEAGRGRRPQDGPQRTVDLPQLELSTAAGAARVSAEGGGRPRVVARSFETNFGRFSPLRISQRRDAWFFVFCHQAALASLSPTWSWTEIFYFQLTL